MSCRQDKAEFMTPELKKLPPTALAPVNFDIDRPIEATLENGLKVVMVKDTRLPLVSYRLAFRTGDAFDPKGKTGSTSAMVSMLTEGSLNFSSHLLADRVERLGASLSASSGYDNTVVAASTLTLYSEEILDILAEVARRPTFPEDELDLYRRNTIEGLKYQRSQPPFLAAEQFARLIYGEHPYAVSSPTQAEVESLQRTDLIRLHRERFIPNNAILFAVGDIEPDEFLRSATERFGDWESGNVIDADFPTPVARTKRTLTIVDRPGSAQSNIVIGNLGAARSDDDYFPALVMNQILGAGASSRVFMNLREEKGYTYGAYTRLNMKKYAGDLEATAEVRNEVTGDSLKEFFYELERIRDENVSDDELADAKSFLTGVFPIRAETQEGLTTLIVNQQLYDLPPDYLQSYRDNVSSVNTEEINSAAKRLIKPDQAAIVIVGDAEVVLPQAGSFAAEVEIYDTDGKRKK